jgi:hypothetical protein
MDRSVTGFRRGVCAGIALALLILVVQQHHHTSLTENASCVACAVRAQSATPTSAPVVVEAPVLLALDLCLDQSQQQPSSLPAPTPRAQGPPAA